MVIDLRHHRQLSQGAHADVFLIGDRVFKLFKTFQIQETELRARWLFQAECGGYKTAMADDRAMKHVPMFYGSLVIESVIYTDGSDVSHRYALGECYEMEYVEGPESKVSDIEHGRPEVREMREYFACICIDAADSSVIFPKNGGTFKLIDFRTQYQK